MAKKKAKSFFAKYGKFLALAVAVLVAVTLVLPAVLPDVENPSKDLIYAGYSVVFGKTLAAGGIEGLGGANSKVYFSFGALVAYLLPVLVTLIGALVIKNNKIFGGLAALVFIASAVLMFLMPQITGISATVEVLGKTTTELTTFAELKYLLGYGAIIGGSLSIVGALVSLGCVVSK